MSIVAPSHNLRSKSKSKSLKGETNRQKRSSNWGSSKLHDFENKKEEELL